MAKIKLNMSIVHKIEKKKEVLSEHIDGAPTVCHLIRIDSWHVKTE